MDVTVIVATHGTPEWQQLAEQRAVPSAIDQAPLIRLHLPDGTLTETRNRALEQARTEWVIYLDADDELEPGYVSALSHGSADLRAPAVRYVSDRRPRPTARVPRVAGHTHTCSAACLPDGNWLVVGTAVRAQMLRDVGGWRDYDWSEDWDTWLRCWRAGATIEAIPQAVYRAHVRLDSRNRAANRDTRTRCHHEIHRANFPELYAKAAA